MQQNINTTSMRARRKGESQHNIDPNSIPWVRFLGVEKTLDHSSAESVKGWQQRILENMKRFNESPLGHRLKKKYTFRHFLKTVRGMNGDHALPEKATAGGIQEMKHDGGGGERTGRRSTGWQ
ncbi:hypothetical protein DFH09DRAFT_1079590 [Mycena vulgaris]|nr:hypothetical protein DFH09DRAFT_1079590 [Mycena vulgaris]